MARWVREGINYRRGQLVASGEEVVPTFSVWARYIGGPASVGRRQIQFTASDAVSARQGMEVTWRWWVPIPDHIDARGWRMVSCMWWVA